jgi:hypothetical protein
MPAFSKKSIPEVSLYLWIKTTRVIPDWCTSLLQSLQGDKV